MNCSDFLARFTEYLDGTAPSEVAEAMEKHARVCGTCGRYRTVVAEGAEVLRSLPRPELRADFEPRLRHRIYSLDDERALAAHQSGAPALTVLGVAVLLAALAWAPLVLGGAHDVRLEPIVVDRAPRQPVTPVPLLLTPPGVFSTARPARLGDGLWTNTRLYEYSELSERYDRRPQVRPAVEFGR